MKHTRPNGDIVELSNGKIEVSDLVYCTEEDHFIRVCKTGPDCLYDEHGNMYVTGHDPITYKKVLRFTAKERTQGVIINNPSMQ